MAQVLSSHEPFFSCSSLVVTAGSPSRGRDAAVYVSDIKQPSLPIPFYSALVSVSVFMSLSTVFHSINSPEKYPLSHRSSGVISVLSVLPAVYLFMKASFSPVIFLCV